MRSELLETARVLMDESGLTLAEMSKLTRIEKHALMRLRRTTLAPTLVNIETVIDKLGYEIVVRRTKK